MKTCQDCGVAIEFPLGTHCEPCWQKLTAARDPSCATLTYESDRDRAFRQAAEATTFDEWFEVICDDIPWGGLMTGTQLQAIARFCWEAGRKAPAGPDARQDAPAGEPAAEVGAA